MSFIEQIKYNIERKKSFLNIKELQVQANFLQTKLNKEIKRYEKFAEKYPAFLTELHTMYQGLYQYYESAYENQLVYRDKYMCGDKFTSPEYAQKFNELDRLIRASYYETGFVYKNSEKTYSSTPATDRLNDFLKTENKEDFFRYCENKKLMFRNKKFLNKSYLSYDQLLEFNGKQRVLQTIFNNIEKYSKLINQLNEQINNKSVEHVSTYDPAGLRKLKNSLIPTFSPNLGKNLDYISLTGIADESFVIHKACEHAKALKQHIESSTLVKAL